MTKAQRATLEVLVEDGGWMRGGKRSSRNGVGGSVNSIAAFSLVDLGYARQSALLWASVFTSGWEFKATDEGKAALAQV